LQGQTLRVLPKISTLRVVFGAKSLHLAVCLIFQCITKTWNGNPAFTNKAVCKIRTNQQGKRTNQDLQSNRFQQTGKKHGRKK
jgi:hypothetical protein